MTLVHKILDTYVAGANNNELHGDGNVYTRNVDGTLTFVQNVFDPGFYLKNYRIYQGALQSFESGTWRNVPRAYSDHFAQYAVFADMFPADYSAWWGTNITPASPTNTVALSGGDLQCDSIAAPVGQVYKASIYKKGFLFTEGDKVRIDALLTLTGTGTWGNSGNAVTILDFGSTFYSSTAELRAIIKDGYIGYELEGLNKLAWTQAIAAVPIGSPFYLGIRFVLSSDPTKGRIELWQDKTKILDVTGKTMQYAFTVHNSLEVGVTATTDTSTRQVKIHNLSINGDPSPWIEKTVNNNI